MQKLNGTINECVMSDMMSDDGFLKCAWMDFCVLAKKVKTYVVPARITFCACFYVLE